MKKKLLSIITVILIGIPVIAEITGPDLSNAQIGYTYTFTTEYSGGPISLDVYPKGNYTLHTHTENLLKVTFHDSGTYRVVLVGIDCPDPANPCEETPYFNVKYPSAEWKNTSGNMILEYGNLGIGTTQPTEKLTVKGTILTSKVKIVHESEIPASDYVFEEDYPLRSLEEVEQFISEKKHLPEVPSAKEFRDNGYSIGKMHDILLRKIEELTLYTIQLQKQLDEKALKIDELIQELETRNAY